MLPSTSVIETGPPNPSGTPDMPPNITAFSQTGDVSSIEICGRLARIIEPLTSGRDTLPAESDTVAVNVTGPSFKDEISSSVTCHESADSTVVFASTVDSPSLTINVIVSPMTASEETSPAISKLIASELSIT